MSEDGELKISGEGKLVGGEGEGSRMRETPRTMGGKPRAWVEGKPSRTSAERLDLADRRRLEDQRPGEWARLPISWYSATQIRVWDKIFALTNDMDEVYVVMNEKEIEGTRTSTMNINYAVSNLLDQLLRYISTRLTDTPGFNADDFKAGRKLLVMNLRRQFNPKLLIALANYFDTIKLHWLGQRIDNLRLRLEQLKPSTVEIPGEASPAHGTSEMLEAVPEETPPEGEVDLERKSIIQARAPFGVVYEEDTLYKKLLNIVKRAVGEVKKGRTKEVVIQEAKVRARATMEKSYEELTKDAVQHAARRTRKKVGLSPEEVKRLELYKQNSLQDFENILRDKLKGVKKK